MKEIDIKDLKMQDYVRDGDICLKGINTIPFSKSISIIHSKDYGVILLNDWYGMVRVVNIAVIKDPTSITSEEFKKALELAAQIADETYSSQIEKGN